MELFVGKSCTPCKMLKAWLNENKINIPQFIAEENIEKAQAAGVKALPSLILDDGKIIQGYDSIKEYFEGDNDE